MSKPGLTLNPFEMELERQLDAGKDDHSGHEKDDHSGHDHSGSDKDTSYSESTKSVFEDDESSYDDRYSKKGALHNVKRFLKKQGKKIIRAFIDYGPPYSENPFDVALINECSRPVLNHFELHKMLNTRLNPNIPDPEDLYDTPIHWCARNAHLLGLKMLRRAGAKFDITNELGLTPLHLAVMMNHPPDRRPTQLKVVKYIIENNANVNIRDKGGYCPIDHAATNQDLEIIEMLIEKGANVLRENHILVAKRHHILKNVVNPDVYRVLYEKLLQEEAEIFKKKKQKERDERTIQEEERFDKLIKSLDKKKQRRLAREQALVSAKITKQLAEERKAKIDEDDEKNNKAKEDFMASNGIWEKNNNTNTWSYYHRGPQTATTESIYQRNLELMKSLEKSNQSSGYNQVWSRLTNGGKLEMPWHRHEPFKLPEIKGAQPKPSNNAHKALSFNA